MKNLLKSNLSWFILFLSLFGIFLPFGMQQSETYSELKFKNQDLQKELNLTKEKLNEVEKKHDNLKESISSIINEYKQEIAKQYKEKEKKYKSKILQCLNQIEEMKKFLHPENNFDWKTESRFSVESIDASISPEIFKTRENLSAKSIGGSMSPDMFKTPTRLTMPEVKDNMLSANKENISNLKRENLTAMIAMDNEEKLNQLNQENQKLKNELVESKNLKAFREKHKTIQHYEEITANYVDLIEMYKRESEKLKHLNQENKDQKETINNLIELIQQYKLKESTLKETFVERLVPKQKEPENELFLKKYHIKEQDRQRLVEKEMFLKFQKENKFFNISELKKVYQVISAGNDLYQNLHEKTQKEEVKIDNLRKKSDDLTFEFSQLDTTK